MKAESLLTDEAILAEVQGVVGRWRDHADGVRADPAQRDTIQAAPKVESVR